MRVCGVVLDKGLCVCVCLFAVVHAPRPHPNSTLRHSNFLLPAGCLKKAHERVRVSV